MSKRAKNVVSTIVGTGLVILSVAACSGGGDQDSPEGLGEALEAAANSEDLDALMGLACKKDQAAVSDDLDFDKIREQMKAPDLKFNVEFVKAETQGDTATLTMKIDLENLPQELQDKGMPTSTEQKQKAIKEDGKWVACT